MRRSQQFLQDMANNTTAVIYVKEASGRYFFVNRRFEEIFGLRADQIIGFTDHQIFPRHFADAFRTNDVEVLERNSTVEYEETAPHLDGPHTYISIKFPLRDQAGIPYALCGISTDISERKQAENLLRSHEQQLRLALSSTQMACGIGTSKPIACSGRRKWTNFSACRLSPAIRRIGDCWPSCIPMIVMIMAQATRQVLEPSRATITFQHRVKRSDGLVLSCIWTRTYRP